MCFICFIFIEFFQIKSQTSKYFGTIQSSCGFFMVCVNGFGSGSLENVRPRTEVCSCGLALFGALTAAIGSMHVPMVGTMSEECSFDLYALLDVWRSRWALLVTSCFGIFISWLSIALSSLVARVV